MESPRFSLKTLLLGISAIALFLAAFRSGSIASFVTVLVVTLLAVSAQTVRAMWTLPRIRPFCIVFAVIGWIGLVITLTARFPISDVNIIRSMQWHLESADASWFNFYGSAALGISYLFATLLCGCICGRIALTVSAGIRTGEKHHNNDDETNHP